MRYRIEEAPVLGGFIYDSISRDLADFTSFSPVYDTAFMTNFESVLTTVNNIVTSQFFIKELKSITTTLNEDVDSLKEPLTKLEGYVRLAKNNLTISPKDFWISEAREKLHSKDVEGLLLRMKIVGENIAVNIAALNTVGFTNVAWDALTAKVTKIKNGNLLQNLKMDEKETAVHNNKEIFKTLDNIMKDVMDTGKRIYKYSHAEKVGDYTLAKLMTRIRHENNSEKTELKEEGESGIVYGVVTNELGDLLESVVVRVVEYELEVETDELGEYYFEAVPTSPVNTVTMTFKLETYEELIVKEVVVEAKGNKEVNGEMRSL